MRNAISRREMITRLAFAAPITGVVLSQTGCGSLTTDIELAITTTEAAVDIAVPQYANLLNPYFTQVTTFFDQLTTELATADSAAQKSAVILADFAMIATPNLNAMGLPAEILTRVAAIAPLLAKLVDEIKASSAVLTETPGGANAFFAAHKSLKPPSAKDLAKLRQKNAALKAKLKR